MLQIERFIEDCRFAAKATEGRKAVLEVVTAAVADAAAVLRALGEPERAGVMKLHHSADLTILNLVWGPHMTVMPHDHRMWAVIGVYTGAEDNIFWRRDGDALRASGARALRPGDAALLGPDAIHSVTNPVMQLTSAIHVYGGDFFATQRSEWDPQTLSELPYDVEKNLRLFDEANARLEAA
jgi:predicted metal-dependent enzyme (double-stranded beta helix superfamily)